jgi:hypothetical protein
VVSRILISGQIHIQLHKGAPPRFASNGTLKARRSSLKDTGCALAGKLGFYSLMAFTALILLLACLNGL